MKRNKKKDFVRPGAKWLKDRYHCTPAQRHTYTQLLSHLPISAPPGYHVVKQPG